MSDAPFIRKGEQVIVDGKLICAVKRDIQSGEMFRVADFQWFITPPVAGEAADATPGFRTTNGAPDVFLSGEWLSDRVMAAKLRKAADISMKAGDDYIAENFTDSDFERGMRDADPNWRNRQEPLKILIDDDPKNGAVGHRVPSPRIDKIGRY